MKCIPKIKILEEKLEKHIIQEKNACKAVDFVFIVKFIATFKDSVNIYFLQEYIRGIELFDVIREIGKFILKIMFLKYFSIL